jgi:hypothetical protein
MTFTDEVLDALGVAATEDGSDAVAGFRVRRRRIRVERWAGPRPYSLAEDCRKERSLLVAPDGRMSCIEVEVVSLLRARWQAGWVQGFPCGSRRWGEWIWSTLGEPLRGLNEQVQAARGKRRTSTFSGHPDVAVTDGRRFAYIECKMEDRLKASQVEWFGHAFGRGIVTPEQVLVVQGLARD